MAFISIFAAVNSLRLYECGAGLRKTSYKNPDFIPTDGTTSHSTKSPKNGNQVAGYAALRKKFLAYI
jgi:hypothetical protein